MTQCTHMICGQPLHYSKPDQIPSIAVVIQKSWAWHIKKRPNSEKISLYPLKRKGFLIQIISSVKRVCLFGRCFSCGPIK